MLNCTDLACVLHHHHFYAHLQHLRVHLDSHHSDHNHHHDHELDEGEFIMNIVHCHMIDDFFCFVFNLSVQKIKKTLSLK